MFDNKSTELFPILYKDNIKQYKVMYNNHYTEIKATMSQRRHNAAYQRLSGKRFIQSYVLINTTVSVWLHFEALSCDMTFFI